MTISNLLPPSEEQKLIINYIKQGKNVIVNAVAGSGKSTTILSIARELPEKRILQITYNSRLRHEIKEKVDTLQFSNISVHTFHSLAVKYYLPSAHTDTELRHILFLKTPIHGVIPNFDILVLDEAQDMSFLYYQFVRKFILDTRHPRLQLLVLGDYNQCLYQFKGADARFLTQAESIWSFMDVFREPEAKRRGRPAKMAAIARDSNFVQCTLKTSYRITHPIAHFVNRVMLGQERMIACREGEPVVYIRNSRHNIVKTVIYEIQQLLEAGDKPSDIFVLGGSVRGTNSNIRKIENILVENNIPCYIPMFDQDKDDRVVDGKIVFSTFHAVKGRQRKHVFVVGFDQGYFQYIARTADPTVCPNTLYVAATRATHRLYLLEFGQHVTDRPLDFLKMGHHEMIESDFVRFKGIPRILFYKPADVESSCSQKLIEKKTETPTGLIKFISDSVMDVISPLIDRMFTCKTVQDCLILSEDEAISIDIPGVVATEYGFEDVSDLNGIALPAMYYDEIQRKYGKLENKNVLYTMIEAALLEMKDNEHQFLKNIVKELPKVCDTIDDYLFLANVYISIQEKLYFKLRQIRKTEYNWLTPKMVELCKSRLDLVLHDECDEKSTLPLTEHTIIHHSMEELHEKVDACLLNHFVGTNLENLRFRFSAVVDLLTEKTLWELKCTTKITIDHQLQVIIYAWLWRITEREPRDFKILNIKTGEIWSLEASTVDLTTIVVSILQGRYGKTIEKTDEEFLSEIRNISHSV
jgi:AAA domain